MRGDRLERKVTKKLVIKTLIFALLLALIFIQAEALDYPHNKLNKISCDSCHFVYGGEPSLLPPWTAHTPQDIDDTQYNTLCWSCHNDIEAPVSNNKIEAINNSYCIYPKYIFTHMIF
jgi:cytochrome c